MEEGRLRKTWRKTIEAEMKTAGKTWKELEKEVTGSNGKLWSEPYLPPRRDEDYVMLPK